jgi:putative two-component system response regulator
MKPEQQPKVLVIDDDDAVRESFRFYLEDNNYTVTEAANGREGLDSFFNDPPDIVLVDLRMPEVSGHRVLEKISKKSPDTPLIVISGTGHINDVVEALRLGAWDYLLKPVDDLTIVNHSISKVLERARLLRENRVYQQHLEEKVEQRTQELTKKVEEMTRFNRMAVGRERRIIELKRQINTLLTELGREPQYRSPDMIEEDLTLLLD